MRFTSFIWNIDGVKKVKQVFTYLPQWCYLNQKDIYTLKKDVEDELFSYGWVQEG